MPLPWWTQAASYFTKKVKERITKPLEIHFHPDFGLGVANTINAVLVGGEVIHTTVTGIGERAGNTPMEETVLALLTMYGIDVGIDYSKLNETARLVQELSGIQVAGNRPFIGEDAYTVESGIPVAWFRNVYDTDPTILFPVRPGFVGHAEPQIVIGKKSGPDNIKMWAQRLNIDLSEEEVMAVLKEVKLQSHDLKRVLTEAEFREIAGRVKAGE